MDEQIIDVPRALNVGIGVFAAGCALLLVFFLLGTHKLKPKECSGCIYVEIPGDDNLVIIEAQSNSESGEASHTPKNMKTNGSRGSLDDKIKALKDQMGFEEEREKSKGGDGG